MNIRLKYHNDISIIFSKINANGGNLWATNDFKVMKGTPFSTRDVALILTDLGYTPKDKIIREIAELLFSLQTRDGRFKISPVGAVYPCHTIGILKVLCNLGYSADKRLEKTFNYLLNIQQDDGGWKCNKYSFGRNIYTNYSNPGPTLDALDAFRFSSNFNSIENKLEKAIDFLLWHWEIKRPIGPCQYGIGSLFNKVEFPFLRYNIFYFCYTLSFYKKAVNDCRFKDAMSSLKNKIKNDSIVVENINSKLKDLDFCKKGESNELATLKFEEILNNININTETSE